MSSIFFIAIRNLPITTSYFSKPRFTASSSYNPRFRGCATQQKISSILSMYQKSYNYIGVILIVNTHNDLVHFSWFSTEFFVSLPSSNNNNDSRQGVTKVVVNIFTKYNNDNPKTPTTKTHRPLVKPLLGLGGVSMVSVPAFIHFRIHFRIHFSMGQR